MGEIRLRTTSNEYTLHVGTSYIEIWNAGKKLYSRLPTAENPFFVVNGNPIDNKQDIIIKGNIENLTCNSIQLTYLDVSKCISLKHLYCYNNLLKQLNIDKNINLSTLNCNNNNIVNLTVDKNINLQKLDCARNKLTNLNIEKNINLFELDCSDNKFASINVEKKFKIKRP